MVEIVLYLIDYHKRIKRICSIIMSEISKLDQILIIKKIDKETINVQTTITKC